MPQCWHQGKLEFFISCLICFGSSVLQLSISCTHYCWGWIPVSQSRTIGQANNNKKKEKKARLQLCISLSGRSGSSDSVFTKLDGVCPHAAVVCVVHQGPCLSQDHSGNILGGQLVINVNTEIVFNFLILERVEGNWLYSRHHICPLLQPAWLAAGYHGDWRPPNHSQGHRQGCGHHLGRKQDCWGHCCWARHPSGGSGPQVQKYLC